MFCKEDLSLDLVVFLFAVAFILCFIYYWCYPSVKGGVLVLKGTIYKCQLDGCSLLATSKANMLTHIMASHKSRRMSNRVIYSFMFILLAILVALLPMAHYSPTVRDVRVRPNEVKIGKVSFNIVRGKLENGTRVYFVPWEMAVLVPSPYMQQLSNSCKDPPVCKSLPLYTRTFNMLKWNMAKSICLLVEDTTEIYPYEAVVNNTITHLFNDFGSYSICIMRSELSYCEFMDTIIEVDV